MRFGSGDEAGTYETTTVLSGCVRREFVVGRCSVQTGQSSLLRVERADEVITTRTAWCGAINGDYFVPSTLDALTMLQSGCAPETPFMGNAMPAVLRGRDLRGRTIIESVESARLVGVTSESKYLPAAPILCSDLLPAAHRNLWILSRLDSHSSVEGAFRFIPWQD
jgi:hypothetical protein